MWKLGALVMLAGCAAYPQVNWPEGDPGQAPALLPVGQLLGEESAASDAAGAALAARAAALQARVAEGK